MQTQTGQLDRRTLLHKRYVIQRTIGQGGMGAVYQAKDIKRHGATCAIKEMSLSMVPPDEQAQAIQNFKIEAKILWGLNHPNLPSFTGFFSENQRYFMVMEFIDGLTLEELLERNRAPFSERRVLGWARQLCDVLEYLHSQNPPIIFRDMKPGNIMLTRNGHIKLIDFGIARFFRPTGSQDTQLLGTPGFAPPEQYGKAQTDERSDIYSLGMTLFQLLTNTFSEQGFGLKDVRAINPQISPVVARALEKATALQPEERYQSVAEFRAALLGVGTFVFENGDLATTSQELADLCARYPEEASDYLAAGEIELWLQEIGQPKLAREAQRIRITTDDPQEAVEQFLQAVMGSNAHIRSYSTTQSSKSSQSSTATRPGPSRAGWFTQQPASSVQVTPRTLDFGQVYPGLSQPMMVMIAGDQGLLVSGTIQSIEPWILLDQTHFDGMSTRVSVRINSSKLLGSTHYTGTIVISPDSDDEQKDFKVTVEVDVLGYAGQKRRGKTIGADLDDDEDDEDDDLTMGMTGSSQAVKPTMTQVGLPPTVQARDNEYKTKYGQPNQHGATTSGWDPVQATPQQRLWHQRALTLFAAFMAASLCYTIVSQLPPLLHTSPLPPSPWFIIVLAGMVPMAALGALLVSRDKTWTLRDTISYACTGMTSTLLALGLFKVAWQISHVATLPPLQLITMLLIASIGAAVGTNPMIGDYIMFGASWILARTRWPSMIAGGLVGGILGYLLTVGSALSWFTPLGVLLGIGVAIAIMWRVDYLMRQTQP